MNLVPIDRARRLLENEGAAADTGAAVARVLDKLEARLSPLIGAGGVRALLARSAKIVDGGRAAILASSALASAGELRTTLQALEPTAAAQLAEALLDSFFALLTSFIGERLTTEALRSAWPTLEQPASTDEQR